MVFCSIPQMVRADADADGADEYHELDLADYAYPYPVSHFELTTQNQAMTMGYMDVRPERVSPRATVLLLHGKNFNGAYWATTIEALRGEGYRVVVPDQIGFGKSTKPKHYQFSFHQLARNTKALLEKLDIQKATVVGHSMGGMLATRFALMYPDTAAQLVLVNPIGLEDYKLKVPYQTIQWWYQNELRKTESDIRAYQKENYYDGKWQPAYDQWVELLAGWVDNPDYATIAWNAALTYDMIFTQPVVYEFGQVRSPTLLIIGTRDRTALGKPLVEPAVRKTMGRFDELGKATAHAIPNATLVELDNVGHLPHIETFSRFAAPLMDFLSHRSADKSGQNGNAVNQADGAEANIRRASIGANRE